MCAAGLAVAAVVMWLLGKAVRFVLTGPAKEAQPAPQKHSSPAVAHRTLGPLDGPAPPTRSLGAPFASNDGRKSSEACLCLK
jgi:hypothetical protein